MPGEKAKDFKGTIRSLLRYMGAFKIGLVAVMVFAVACVSIGGLIALLLAAIAGIGIYSKCLARKRETGKN